MKYILFLGLSIFLLPQNGKTQEKGQKYYIYADSCYKKGDYKQAYLNFKIARDLNYNPADLALKIQNAKKCREVSDSFRVVMQAGLYQIGRHLLSKILGKNPFDKKAQSKMLAINSYFRNRPKNMVFIQGSSIDKELVNDFFMAEHEVTVAEYCRFLNSQKPDSSQIMEWIEIDNSSQIKFETGKFTASKGQSKFPVVDITWRGAMAYAHNYGLELPSVKEWKLATKGIENEKDFCKIAWCKLNSEQHFHAVKTLESDKNGIYDLVGNVWEWTTDIYKNPAVYAYSYNQRITVGGSYAMEIHSLKKLQNYYREDEKLPNVGFRCVKHIKIPNLKGKSFYN